MIFNKKEQIEGFDKYIMKDIGNEALMPTGNFVNFSAQLSMRVKNDIYNENEEIPRLKEMKDKLKFAYLELFQDCIEKFGNAVNENQISIYNFPIKEWVYLANDEDTRFVYPSFYELFAQTIENAQLKQNDIFIYMSNDLKPKELSEIVARLKKVETVHTFVKDLQRINPMIIEDENFHPFEDMINIGNHELLKHSLDSAKINQLVSERLLKDIEKVSIDSNLILRLGSEDDILTKKNIVKSLCVANDYGLLQKQLHDVKNKNKSHYSALSHIKVDSKLNYAEVYLFSNNNIALFENNNERLVKLKKIQDEKMSENIEKKPTSIYAFK